MSTYTTSNKITVDTVAITSGTSTGSIPNYATVTIPNYATPTFVYTYDTTASTDTTTTTSTKSKEPTFTWVKEYVPNKVYGFKIDNSKKIIKTVCDDSDEFNLEYAFFLAIAKHLYSSTLTFEGVLEKARQLSYNKQYVKIVKDGIKLFKLLKNEEEKKQKYDKEQKAIKKRRTEKKRRRHEARLEKQKELIKQAILESKNEY